MKHSHHHAPRVSSIKTRIKTNKETKITLLSPLREYLPLKQGLRQQFLVQKHIQFPPRVSSIKTRIKTHEHSSLVEQRSLREYLPLKQGLRHILHLKVLYALSTPRVSSIKTRIKTKAFLYNKRNSIELREYLPLKQGLRLLILLLLLKAAVLREYLPLKQGLRLQFLNLTARFYISPRVSSIKTRIKTD